MSVKKNLLDFINHADILIFKEQGMGQVLGEYIAFRVRHILNLILKCDLKSLF